jgi:putative RNA 2'-phosphotransferase
MGRVKDPKKLAKLLDYVLGRNPDEFGLVPDGDGFVKTKELLKALHEEEGWKFVRQAAIDEVLYSILKPPVEVTEDRIRAIGREHLEKRVYAAEPPLLLYTCVRRRAYPHTLKKGVTPMGRKHVVLSSDADLALRLGRRFDADPVLLTVNVDQAHDRGCMFLKASQRLFLCRQLPEGCFSGPALPKEKKDPPTKEVPKTPKRSETPGSYFPDLAESQPQKHLTKKQRRRDEVAWKSARRRKSRRKS